MWWASRHRLLASYSFGLNVAWLVVADGAWLVAIAAAVVRASAGVVRHREDEAGTVVDLHTGVTCCHLESYKLMSLMKTLLIVWSRI